MLSVSGTGVPGLAVVAAPDEATVVALLSALFTVVAVSVLSPLLHAPTTIDTATNEATSTFVDCLVLRTELPLRRFGSQNPSLDVLHERP
jgi:hypothetical protein